jgi:trk system potassium uptake protein TrkH
MSLYRKIRGWSYPQLIAFGYFVLILTGTLLLLLPWSTKNPLSTDFLTALFTATSATCVTGLVVVDTFTHWTTFGQIIILLLIQIGGLGFMTVITMISFFLHRKIGLKERGLLRESVNTLYIGGIVKLTKKILVGTFLFEFIGALLLATRFIPELGWTTGVYYAIFHSISAFCNAGFDLMGRFQAFGSLAEFRGDITIALTLSALIFVGGIGFYVWDDALHAKFRFRKMQLHSKLVLTTSMILIVGGALLIFVLEKNNALAGLSLPSALSTSLFESVTPRTAGFTMISPASLNPATHFIQLIYMFIGGSPGSAAGGVKTTTIAILLLSLRANMMRTKDNQVFGRRLEDNVLRRAASVITVNLLLITCGTIIVASLNPNFSLFTILYEIVSAMGTVGLSFGITPILGVASQVVLMTLMFFGRVGSLTFALIFTERKQLSCIQNPIGKVTVG